MDFEYFYALSEADANELLRRYLKAEARRTLALAAALENEGLRADLSVTTLPDVLVAVARHVERVREVGDGRLPDWLERDDYLPDVLDYRDGSQPLVVAASFYLGESFVRAYPVLQWTVGAPDTIEHNMPVVAGFRKGVEMATIMIVENLLRPPVVERARIETAVETWSRAIS
jgi:hypothetical protein